MSIENGLDQQGHGHLIEEMGVTVWPDGTRGRAYAFQHAAFRRILYARISPTRRQRLHLLIGERIETAHQEDLAPLSAELAVHFEHAGDLLRTVAHLKRAAGFAKQRFANREAADYLKRAIDLLHRGAASDEERAVIELALRRELIREESISNGIPSLIS